MANKWDEKYRRGGGAREEAELLREWASELPTTGRALDLACGAGRNAVWLAQQGLTVDAIDSSAEGLRRAAERAEQRGVSIRTIEADLETDDIGNACYDVIANFFYLDRDLVPRIQRALAPGGILFFETYTIQQADLATGPSNPAFLLQPGELATLFPALKTLHYAEQDNGTRAVASLVARNRNPSSEPGFKE